MISVLKPWSIIGGKLSAKTQVYNVFSKGPLAVAKRNLNLHEHMSYGILKKYGIPVPKHCVVTQPQKAISCAKEIECDKLIIKAQVLCGGRGKGKFKKSGKPGVISFSAPEEAKDLACHMIGDTLITVQTGAQGKICNSVMIAERKEAKKEYYVSIMMERSFNGPVIICSREGGVEIEKVAAEKPSAITTIPIDIIEGLKLDTAEKVAKVLGLELKKTKITDLLMKMYKLFIKCDASLVEINPLIEDTEGNFVCLDAKINFDENANFRQQEIFAKRDYTQEDEKEVKAAKFDLNYVAMDGDIGCMVNGAGLAMSTMDIIQLSGGVPANFLDVGGGTSAKLVKEAFKIIISDKKVSAIFVNIFGGIVRCDMIAEGILNAVRELNVKLPIVVRLQGTNQEEAREMIIKANLGINSEDDFAKAATLVVKLAKAESKK